MRARLRSVSRVMIGLDRVGLVGLEKAFEKADESGLVDREELIDLLMQALSRRNYIPTASEDEYRRAVWREYLRHRGEEIRHLYPEVEVIVRGEAGADRDRMVGAVAAVLGEHELKPSFRYEPPGAAGSNPQVSIANQVVIEGVHGESAVRRAIKLGMDDW